MGRWIKIYDKFLQWEWFGKAEMVQLFLYLLLKAKHKDGKWQGKTIPKGTVVITRRALSVELGLSEQTVRTCIKRLVSTHEITYKATKQYSVITICNYDTYQNNVEQESQRANPQINPQSTHDQPTDNPQSTHDQPTDNPQINPVAESGKIGDSQEVASNTGGDTNQQGESESIAAELCNREKSTHIQEYRIKKEDNKETSLTRGKENAAAVAATTSASDEAEAPKPIKAEKREAVPFTKIKDLWNEVCVGYPRLVKISDSRKNKISNRVADMGGVEKALPMLRQIFTKMQASNFLRGDNKRGWKASFDWLFENDKNWVKVYEGNYDNRLDPVQRYRTNNGKNCNDEWK